MNARRSIPIALAGAMLALAVPGADAMLGTAAGLPTTFEASASAAAATVSVAKPAMLPTSDEVATIAFPYAQVETSSSPLGRAIGSWLWPGETVADAKSLLLVGADPGADEAACSDREAGRSHAAVLATIPNPAGAPITITDPADNPCGAAGVKQILTGKIGDDGTRSGGVVRALPDYPFWARAQYPANDAADASSTQRLCGTPGALPQQPWRTPRDACDPNVKEAQLGFATAHALRNRQSASSTIGSLDASPVGLGAMSATSAIVWRGDVLVSQSSSQIDDIALAAPGSAKPFLTIESLRSSAVASSDARLTKGFLTIAGARAALPGLPSGMECSQSKPCPVAIGDGGITPVVPVNDLVRQALRLIDVRIAETPVDAAGYAASAGAVAGGPGTTISSDRRSVVVAGLAVEIAGATSLEGRTITRFVLGAARAAAIAGAFAPASRDPRRDTVQDPPTPPDAAPGIGPLDSGVTAQPDAGGVRLANPAPIALARTPASQPIPPGIALLAFVAVLGGAWALIAFGVWETDPDAGQ